jgi:quercetin dioxygenase-like cupin family protein
VIVRNYRKVTAAPVVEEPGVTVRWLANEQEEAPNSAMRLYEIEPRAATASCTHYWETEVLIMAGNGAVSGEHDEIPLDEGDVLYVPAAEQHGYANRGDEVLRFLVVLPIPQRTPLQVRYGVHRVSHLSPGAGPDLDGRAAGPHATGVGPGPGCSLPV